MAEAPAPGGRRGEDPAGRGTPGGTPRDQPPGDGNYAGRRAAGGRSAGGSPDRGRADKRDARRARRLARGFAAGGCWTGGDPVLR